MNSLYGYNGSVSGCYITPSPSPLMSQAKALQWLIPYLGHPQLNQHQPMRNFKETPPLMSPLFSVTLQQQRNELLRSSSTSSRMRSAKSWWSSVSHNGLRNTTLAIGSPGLWSRVAQERSVVDGLLLRGNRIVIPQSLRQDILRNIHAGHLGIVECRERARQGVWWPGLSKQLEELVKNCKEWPSVFLDSLCSVFK